MFEVGPAGELYGPYSPQGTISMKNATGVLPMFSRTSPDAGLCASCHTIELPVFDRNGRQVLDEHGKPKSEFEQTTFFEWFEQHLSSSAGDQPCQQCHMPKTYRGADLSFKIANIEDNTFPQVPDIGPSTRLPDSDLTLPVRNPYGRHQLNGINLFVLEMFDQFRKDLGLFKVDPNLPSSIRDQISGQKTAVAEGVLQAQTATAKVAVNSVSTDATTLTCERYG